MIKSTHRKVFRALIATSTLSDSDRLYMLRLYDKATKIDHENYIKNHYSNQAKKENK